MAVYPNAPGKVDLSSTGTSKWIPAIWSGKTQKKFYIQSKWPLISNTEYEGEIKKQGDKVIIRTVPDVSVREYSRGQDLTYEELESANVELLIDKGFYWAFAADDIDQKQSDINYVEKLTTDAAQQLDIAIDRKVINGVFGDASADNIGTTAGVSTGGYNLGTTASAVALTKDNVEDYLADCAAVLTEQNIPLEDRFFLAPTWFMNLMYKSDLKAADMMGDGKSAIKAGFKGKFYDFNIFETNNYTPVTDTYQCYNILFGHKSAITFAQQITKMEKIRSERTFGDKVRALSVFGFEVIVPKALGVLYARKA